MKDLDLITLCQGMVATKNNALELLEDAKILRANGRLARAYAAAYMACEENGKISILFGAATQIIIGRSVDWKSTAKRFRSHNSKASQFMGLANSLPILERAIKEKQKSINLDEMFFKTLVGVTAGPMMLPRRNASLYCDLVDGVFEKPSDVITSDLVNEMINTAEINIRIATVLICDTAEETAEKLRERTSAQQHDLLMNSTINFVEKFYDNLPPTEEMQAKAKEILARKASKI